MLEGTSLPVVEETSLVAMTSEDWEDITSEAEETKSEKTVALELEIDESLPDSDEEDGLRIAPVMSSFFDDEDDDSKEEDTVAKILVTKDDAPPAADV